MLILRGTPALSDFRLQKLSSDFKSAGLSVATVYAEFLHVVDLSADLTDAETETLKKVLHYGPVSKANSLWCARVRVPSARGAPRRPISLTSAASRLSSASNAQSLIT